MNKRIEEMAREFCSICHGRHKCENAGPRTMAEIVTEGLYEKGYRKQSDVNLDAFIEQIIRKKAEVSDYWINYLKRFRAMKVYSEIEHEVDNFLRGYNEAVDDMIAILDGSKMKGADDEKEE